MHVKILIATLLASGMWTAMASWADPPTPTVGQLTTDQEEGRRQFQYHCAACHVSAFPSAEANGGTSEPYAPRLSRLVVQDGNDDAFRQVVMNGTASMPGFRFALAASQLNLIADYLKTLAIPPRTVASEHPQL